MRMGATVAVCTLTFTTSVPWRYCDMDKLSISTAVLALGAAVLGLSWAFTTNKRARKPLPPGPKPLPFIGNLLDFPQEKPAQVFAQWGREYSASNCHG